MSQLRQRRSLANSAVGVLQTSRTRVLVVVNGRDPGQGTGGWSGGGSRGVGGRARRWVKEGKEKRKVAPS